MLTALSTYIPSHFNVLQVPHHTMTVHLINQKSSLSQIFGISCLARFRNSWRIFWDCVKLKMA